MLVFYLITPWFDYIIHFCRFYLIHKSTLLLAFIDSSNECHFYSFYFQKFMILTQLMISFLFQLWHLILAIVDFLPSLSCCFTTNFYRFLGVTFTHLCKQSGLLEFMYLIFKAHLSFTEPFRPLCLCLPELWQFFLLVFSYT